MISEFAGFWTPRYYPHWAEARLCPLVFSSLSHFWLVLFFRRPIPVLGDGAGWNAQPRSPSLQTSCQGSAPGLSPSLGSSRSRFPVFPGCSSDFVQQFHLQSPLPCPFLLARSVPEAFVCQRELKG